VNVLVRCSSKNSAAGQSDGGGQEKQEEEEERFSCKIIRKRGPGWMKQPETRRLSGQVDRWMEEAELGWVGE
jgi:hypothetical protein